MITVCSEGWRFLPHSYAIVNQWQCLEMLKRPDVEVYFRDLPFYLERWRPIRGLFRPQEEAALERLAPPPQDSRLDCVLRLSVPVRFSRSAARRLLVFGTADFGWLPNVMIENGQSLAEAHKASDAIIVSPSRWSQWGLVRAGADPARVRVVPCGIDAGIFRPAKQAARQALRARAGWADRFVFLNVSAQTLSKGTDLILKAFARVVARHPHALLVLKGSDDVYGSQGLLKRWLSERLGAEDRQAVLRNIRYIGTSLPFAGLARVYQAADAYVTPYRSESFNLPALEAAACGLPLICTQGGPTDEYTTPQFARRIPARLAAGNRPYELIRHPDLDALTQAMFDVIESPSLRDSALAHGPAHIQARFTWRHVLDELMAVMRG